MAISTTLLYLAERSNELFFVYDLFNNKFTYMNATCISFFNLKSIDVESKVILDTIHPEDQRYILYSLKDCIEGKTVADVECRIIFTDHERWLRITPYALNDNGENLLVGQAQDITAYKVNTEILNNHNNKKNTILNILAHDLAGPIGTIGNLSEMLGKETVKFNDPTVNRYISLITRISKSSINLIHAFIDQEFLESVDGALLKTRTELINKIKLTTEDYFAVQKDFNIHFSCQANKETIFVAIDEDKFMQVITNLISNALKFTQDHGSIKIYIEERKEEVLISIADSGIGIPKKYHATLFDKFSNARRKGLKGEPSTGLGMSIIKTIVEWHNGKIWFESEEQKGTTFYIQLPKV